MGPYLPTHTRHEVICHNDFAPYNLVTRNNRICGVIDFDVAGPGPRLRDLAYFAYWTVPLSFAAEDLLPFTDRDIANGHKRLQLIAKTYGTSDFRQLFSYLSEILHHLADFEIAARVQGLDVAQTLKAGGHFKHWQREAKAFDANWQRVFQSLL